MQSVLINYNITDKIIFVKQIQIIRQYLFISSDIIEPPC